MFVSLLTNYYKELSEEAEFRHEETFTRYAKLLCTVSADDFTLGHYHTNPAEQPDFVSKSLCRFHSPSQGDPEILYWRLLQISEAISNEAEALVVKELGNDSQAELDAEENLWYENQPFDE